MSFRTFWRLWFFTTRKSSAFKTQITRHMKLFTTCLSRTKNIRKSILLRHNMQKTSIFLLKKIILFYFVFCCCASHNDKFVTRLSFVILIVWFTKLDDNNTAFIFFWNSSSYIKKRFEQKDLSRKWNDRLRRVTSLTRRRVVVDS